MARRDSISFFDGFTDAPEEGERPRRRSDPDAEPWERTYAMWTHLAPMIAFVLVVASSGVVFFTPPLTALVLWLIRKGQSPFIDDHGREAINFQVSLLLLFVPAVILGVLLCGVGVLLTLPAWALLGIAGGAIGANAASRGEFYRYPLCFRFLR